MGSIGRQYGEAIQGKVSFGVGGGAAPPPAQGRVLDDQAIATIVALREIGAPPAVLMRAAREAQARMGQEDLVRADASLLEQPMRNEGGPDEIPGIVLGAQMAPKTLLSPEQEAIERAISAGLVKTDQHFGNVMDRSRLEESIRQHQALEGYRTRPRGGGGMGTKQRTALLAEAHRLKQEAAENRKRAEDELAETQGQDKTRMEPELDAVTKQPTGRMVERSYKTAPRYDPNDKEGKARIARAAKLRDEADIADVDAADLREQARQAGLGPRKRKAKISEGEDFSVEARDAPPRDGQHQPTPDNIRRSVQVAMNMADPVAGLKIMDDDPDLSAPLKAAVRKQVLAEVQKKRRAAEISYLMTAESPEAKRRAEELARQRRLREAPLPGLGDIIR